MMDNRSLIDPTRNTVGSIYRDAQINGERGVIVGDMAHEMKKDLVKDINEAIEIGKNHPEIKGKPFYVIIYEKSELTMKQSMVRLRNVSLKRPYPEQDTIVFRVFPNDDVYFCWALPHRSQMLNIIMNPEIYDADQIELIRRWENLQLEYFGFMKNEKGNWAENPLYRGDSLLGAPDGQKQVKIVMA